MSVRRRLAFVLSLTACLGGARAEISVPDDSGVLVRLAAPARRIVSLAPHLTENLYAAGAGDRLVAAVDYSDYPAAAKLLPRVGSYAQLDLEAIVAARPDLVVAWPEGNGPTVLARLTALGLPVYRSAPRRLEDIADGIARLGQLAGSEAAAHRAAAEFRYGLAALRRRHADRPPVRLFYQVWNPPLLTVGDNHIIGDVIRLCGGRNVFATLTAPAPTVGIEAVLAAAPEAIVASGMGRDTPVGLDSWRAWPTLAAVAAGNLYFVEADYLQRPTPRILLGAARLCAHLENARAGRAERLGQGAPGD